MKNSNTIPTGELSILCEQIALAMRSGIPIEETMDAVAEAFADTPYKDKIGVVRQAVGNGSTLCEAMEKSGAFERRTCVMVGIGERAGKLDDVMSGMASYYSWEASVRTAITNTVVYPTVLALMLTIIIAVLLAKVMPVFERVFASFGIDASAAMSAGMVIGYISLTVIAVMAVALVVALVLLRTGAGEGFLDRISRLLPFIGRLRTKLSRSRFLSVMHIMLTAGCQTEDSVEMASKAVSYGDYSQRASRVSVDMEAGASFPDAIQTEKLFDAMDTKIIRFGDSAGCLDDVLWDISEKCRRSAEDMLLGITAVIEPVLVAVLSVVIGGILLSMMLPLLQILSAMN